MATQPPISSPLQPEGPQGTPSPQTGISAELREVLAFTERENDKHRDYFKTLYTYTASALTLIFLAIGGVVAFFGWHSVDDIRKQAKAATDAEIQRIQQQGELTLSIQTAKVQQQINKRLDEEFATPAIKRTVQEAAKQQTVGTLRPIITGEVRSRVASGVKAEQSHIQQTLTEQVHTSVDALKPTIDKRVDETVSQSVNAAVKSQVDAQISPRLLELESAEQISLLISKANSDDAASFDTLAGIAGNPSTPQATRDLALKVVRARLQAAQGLVLIQNFTEPKTEAQSLELLHDPYSLTRQAAVNSLGNAYWKSHLDQLFSIMSTDGSLDVRTAAFNKFKEITQIKGVPLDNYGNTVWWNAHRKDFVK